MSLASLIALWGWLQKNWKLTTSLVAVFLFAFVVMNYRHTIRKQAVSILEQKVTLAQLESQLQSANNLVDLQNAALVDMEKAKERSDKAVDKALWKVADIKAEVKSMQIKMAEIRKQSGDCDDVLIKLGKQLGEIQWRN